ncbi:hypothetical protein ABTY20_03665 [Streptomyces sp. NPDC126497]
MRQSSDWTVLAYKGLGGAPMWVVIGLLVLGLVWVAVAASRKRK